MSVTQNSAHSDLIEANKISYLLLAHGSGKLEYCFYLAFGELIAHWPLDRLFVAPSSKKPVGYNPGMDAIFFRHFNNAGRHPIDSNKRICSTIPSLLFCVCPYAVIRRVISAGIFSFYRQSIRPFSHVFVKLSKLMPSFANSNSTTSVILELFVGSLVASLHHGSPAIPNGRGTHFVLLRL